jgi:hypothetical protein
MPNLRPSKPQPKLYSRRWGSQPQRRLHPSREAKKAIKLKAPLEALRLKVGKHVVLVGYGCGARGSVGEIGQLRQGDAVIVTVIAREQSPAASDNREAYTATQGAVACAGDGGGGLFEPLDQRGERPTLLGVLSRSDRQQISYSATVSAQTFLNFAKRWSDENNRAVCGLDADPTTCELPSITVSSPPGPSTISTPIIANVFYKAGERVQNIVSRFVALRIQHIMRS